MIPKAVEQARIIKAMRDCPKPILSPMDCVKKAIDDFGDQLAVSCSFGSCSVVVLHMALSLAPGIKVVFCNTGVQYPETYRFRDRLVKEWNLNLIETKPIHSFWYCVKRWGFPEFRSSKGSGKPHCCIYLKDYPMRKISKENNIVATITGMRAAESRARMFNFADRGQYYHTKKYNLWKFNPIAFWSREQTWDYIHNHNLPVNELYLKGHERSGCMPCTGFKGWAEILAKRKPKLYRYIQHLRGQSLITDFEKELAGRCIEVASKKARISMLEEWF